MALIDDIKAYWKLDESSGDAADATGNGNTATNINTVTYSGTDPKINNHALTENSPSRYLEAADSTSLSITGDITISMWINRTSALASLDTQAYISKQNTTGNQSSWYISHENDGGIRLLCNFDESGDNAGETTRALFTQTFTTGTWYHLVVKYTCSTKAVVIYINGTPNAPSSYSEQLANSIFDSTAPVRIGAGNVATPGAHASIDEVGIWARALSDAEVTELYNSGAGLAYPFGGGGAVHIPTLLTLGAG